MEKRSTKTDSTDLNIIQIPYPVPEKLGKTVEQDKYTFSVLLWNLKEPCRLLMADEDLEKIVIFYSIPPYPLWIWTKDGLSEADKDALWQTLIRQGALQEEGPLAGIDRFNVKEEMADYLIKKAKETGHHAFIQLGMLAYDDPEPVPPHIAAEGKLRQGTMDDLEILCRFRRAFHDELQIDMGTEEEYREKTLSYLQSGEAYLWEADGEVVSSCTLKLSEEMGYVSSVYTPPEHRRKHFAENMVYGVTCIARDHGVVPCLYTDADYAASNACYQKVGYMLRGSLCTVQIGADATE